MENKELHEIEKNAYKEDSNNSEGKTKKIIFTPSSEKDNKGVHFKPSFNDISTTQDVLIKTKYTTE